MKLELKHLSAYLPYNPKVLNGYGDISDLKTEFIRYPKLYLNSNKIDNIALILRPLSDLTKEINYGLSIYAFIDLFEIGDCDGCVFEFEHGNIKTIKALENISKYNLYNDINYLPNAVVNMMYEYHFDVFGLIEKGLAVDINKC